MYIITCILGFFIRSKQIYGHTTTKDPNLCWEDTLGEEPSPGTCSALAGNCKKPQDVAYDLGTGTEAGQTLENICLTGNINRCTEALAAQIIASEECCSCPAVAGLAQSSSPPKMISMLAQQQILTKQMDCDCAWVDRLAVQTDSY